MCSSDSLFVVLTAPDSDIFMQHRSTLAGLFNTFANTGGTDDPCSSDNPNDFIDDTPQHAMASDEDFDCTIFLEDGAPDLPNTCPNQEGNDPIFNYVRNHQEILYLLFLLFHPTSHLFTFYHVVSHADEQRQ